MGRVWRLTPLLVALLGTTAGCEFADSADSVVNSCGMSSDCGSDERCDGELSACVSRKAADYELLLRVTAPATEAALAAPPTLFGPVTLDKSVSSRTLTVQNTRVVTGHVAVRSGDADTSLAVELLFTPRVARLGADAETLSVVSTAEVRNDTPQGANFRAMLRQQTTYDVEVVPGAAASSLVPPRVFEVSPEMVESGHLELFYDALMPMVGRVIDSDGQAQADVGVRAVHPETGAVVSSRAVTDAQGDFELEIDTDLEAEGDVPWLLEIGPTSEAPWFPTWKAELRDIAFGPERVTLTLPAIPMRVPIELAVESEPEPGLYSKLGGAQVTFTSELLLLRPDGSETPATATRSGQTSTDGAGLGLLTLELPVGRYQVLALPPNESTNLAPVVVPDFQVVQQPPGSTQRGVTFLVPPRTHMTGTVKDAAGRELPSLNVRSRTSWGAEPPPDSAKLPEVARYARGTSAVTELDGSYDLPLDVGTYDVVFEPNEGLGYPWHVLPGVRVESGKKLERDVKVSAPVVLHGDVQFDDGREPAGALVSAFAEIADADAPEGTRYVQVGRATVLDDGSYQLYLPASLPGSR